MIEQLFNTHLETLLQIFTLTGVLLTGVAVAFVAKITITHKL